MYLQESNVGGVIQAHQAYGIRLGTVGELKKQRVAIEVAITAKNRLIVEARTDIISHFYFQALDVWKLEK